MSIKVFLCLTASVIVLSPGHCVAEKRWPDEPLRGVNTKPLVKAAPGGNVPARPLDDDDLERLHGWGVRVLRVFLGVDEGSPWEVRAKGRAATLPADYSLPPIPPNDPVAPYRKSLDALGVLLDRARKHGIFIIPVASDIVGRKVDVLYQNSDGQGYHRYLTDLWVHVAHRFGAHPALLAYDLLNEPHTANEVRQWQTRVLPDLARTIRKIDRDTYFVVEPGPWGMPTGFATLKPLDDPKVVYSFHFYAPQMYTHQGVKGWPRHTPADPRIYPGKLKMFPTSPEVYWDRRQLEQYVAPAVEFQRRYGVRIFVGEFSVIRWAPNAADWLRDATSVFNEHGWDWCYHSYGGWNGWNPTFDADAPMGVQLDGGKTTDRLKVLIDGLRRQATSCPTTRTK